MIDRPASAMLAAGKANGGLGGEHGPCFPEGFSVRAEGINAYI